MKHLHTIKELDTTILYVYEPVSSLSVLLFAFGLIASIVNVPTKGSVSTDNYYYATYTDIAAMSVYSLRRCTGDIRLQWCSSSSPTP
jgi:hypothetical protein